VNSYQIKQASRDYVMLHAFHTIFSLYFSNIRLYFYY